VGGADRQDGECGQRDEVCRGLHDDLFYLGVLRRRSGPLVWAASPGAVTARLRSGASAVAVLVTGVMVEGGRRPLQIPPLSEVYYARVMQFRVLGPLEVEADGGPVALGGRRNACCWPCC
jgi:hypothetical protein